MLASPNDSPETDSILPWWALYTRHQHEKTVAEMLESKECDVFLPLYESVRRWKDRRKVLSLPLFPGYVFVRARPSRRLHIVTTPGVHMILCHGDNLATIPDEEIEAIRRTVSGNYRVEPHPFLRCGDRVRVTRGSLDGIEGILVRKKNVFRLVLSVAMLSQSVAVEIDAADVVPVGAQSVAGSHHNSPSETDRLPQYPIPAHGIEWSNGEAMPQSLARVG
jgi:transcription antitermination factor NusG